MGSGEHSLSLAKVFSQDYDVQEEESFSANSLEELEQEQSLEATQGNSAMPLDELLALYGYEVSDRISQHDGEPTELPASLPDMTLDKDQIAKELLSGEEEEEARSSADDLTPSVTSHASDLFRAQAGEDRDYSGSSSGEDSECSSIPSNDGRKDIMVGPQYQAVIPALCPYSHEERAYESEDQLLWAPAVLPEEAVEEFLLQAQRWGGDTTTPGQIIRDNEQALYELVKCSFNTEEALRRLRFNVKVFREELCAWSEEECRNFEHGYRVHGKNFHLIQANKVRTRSVGECVEYYYMWKKSARHEYFTLQTTKLGRRKYSLQAGAMEDGEQDGDGQEIEGGRLSRSLPPGPVPTSQTHLPPPTNTLDLDIRDGELGGAELKQHGGSDSGCPREALFKMACFPTQDDCQEARATCASPPCHPTSPAAPPALLASCSNVPPRELLGPALYQLQLEPFSVPSVSLPSTPLSPAVSVPSTFGAISSFLHPAPIPHPRSVTQ